MKKTFVIGICLLAAAITIWGFISLRNAALSEETDLYTALPQKPDLLFEIQRAGDLSQSMLYNNGYWQYWKENPELQLLSLILSETDTLRESQSGIATDRPMQLAVYFRDGASASLLSTRVSADEWRYWNKRLAHYPHLHRQYHKGVMSVSADSSLLARSAEALDKRESVMEGDTAFQTLSHTVGSQVPMSVYLCHESLNRLLAAASDSPCPELASLMRKGIGWSVLDFEIRERQLVLSGFALPDSKTSVLERMRVQTPATNRIESALPAGTVYYCHQNIDDLEAYRTANGKLSAIEDSMWRCADGSSTLAFFRQYFDGEWAHGFGSDGPFVVVRLNDSENAARDLQHLAEGLHAGHEQGAYRFGLCGFAASVLGPDALLQREFVSIQGQNLWITTQAGTAAAIANAPKLTDDARYKAARASMQTESSETRFYRLSGLLPLIDRQVSEAWAEHHIGWLELLCPFGCLTAQSEYSSGNLTYRNLTLSQADRYLSLSHRAQKAPSDYTATPEPMAEEPADSPAETVATEPETAPAAETPVAIADIPTPASAASATVQADKLAEVMLDAPAAMRPQVFKNHLNGENEIIVQDTKKQLYLISASGNIVWKIQLSEFILGDVFAVDMLGNKKWQMTFVTPSKWFVIDRKGNNLAGFPIALNPQASAGLQVVDYENKADYRFFIPRKGGKVNLLKKDGRQPQDWSYKSSGKDVEQAVQHFSAGGKDYLVCTGSQCSQVVDRRGRTRIATEGIGGWSKNPLIADGSGSSMRMVGTAPDGDLQFVYADGRAISTPIESGMSAGHSFGMLSDGTEKHYLLGDEKGLKVFNEDFELLVKDASLSVGGRIQYFGEKAFFHNSTDKTLWLYDRTKRQCSGSGIGCDSPHFTITTLKPHTGTCLLTTSDNKVMIYRLK
ncbi:MAG: hypothetical protein ILP04_01470 [Bacteroidales bacterium]|nr:hypothetical protein [Bacteroidales bacterium]